MHFNSVLVDPKNITGSKVTHVPLPPPSLPTVTHRSPPYLAPAAAAAPAPIPSFVQAINELPTDFLDFDRTVPPKRVSMSVPIVLPCTAYTKNAIETSGKKAVALVNKHGQTMAILRNPEIYVNRKEEIVARIFGVIDPGHPYISHIYKGGDWLIGGEIELLDRIRYNDGLDQWRLTAPEVMREFEAKNTDAVFAFQVSTCVDVWVDVCFLFRRSTYLFPALALPHLSLFLKRTRLRLHQTRNPTHAGHAYLMRTAREILLKKGYSNPVSTHTRTDTDTRKHSSFFSHAVLLASRYPLFVVFRLLGRVQPFLPTLAPHNTFLTLLSPDARCPLTTTGAVAVAAGRLDQVRRRAPRRARQAGTRACPSHRPVAIDTFLPLTLSPMPLLRLPPCCAYCMCSPFTDCCANRLCYSQHEAIIADGMLDAATTVMAIWPAPMIYAGPTEVRFLDPLSALFFPPTRPIFAPTCTVFSGVFSQPPLCIVSVRVGCRCCFTRNPGATPGRRTSWRGATRRA